MTQALTVKPQQRVSRYNEQDIQQEMSILKSAFPKLNAPTDALRALVIASKFSGLNPFRGEIYYVPNVGITVASKIKAADAITYQQMRGNTLDVKFDLVTAAMVQGIPEYSQYQVVEGDVAYLCRIISSKQRTAYFNHRLQIIDELKALGYVRQELEQELNRRAGPAPEIKALGVVRKAENFGGDTKYSRNDRAMKRALQLALNIGGYAAPDTRSYGGVALQDDKPAGDQTVDGDYSVVANEPDIPRKPRVTMPDMPMEDGWTIDDAPQPPQPSAEHNNGALRGHEDLHSPEPFGEDKKLQSFDIEPLIPVAKMSVSEIRAVVDSAIHTSKHLDNARAIEMWKKIAAAAKSAGLDQVIADNKIKTDTSTGTIEHYTRNIADAVIKAAQPA